jgi:hypothetical protein
MHLLAIQSIQMLAKSLKHLQQHLHSLTAVQLLPLSHRQRHRRLPASAQVAAGARPGSPVRWRIRMKHW